MFPYKTSGRAPYENGFIRCQACNLYVKCTEIKCPCCMTDFRRRPRHGKYRKRLLAEIKRY